MRGSFLVKTFWTDSTNVPLS